jgi:galactokinase/mevalonate kinase-like predicted kinase
MIVSTAPGRCGIVGNPTDMYGGSVISCSTVERARCTIMDSPGLTISVSGFVQMIRTPDDMRLQGNYLDIPKAVLTYFELTPANFRCRLSASSEIPESAGLAGSTALVVAVLGAVLEKMGVEMDRFSIAETARKIEYRVMGITCGYQDQHMAAFGGLNYMDFRGKERLAQDENEPLATVEPLQSTVGELPIVVAHTGIMRNSGVVHKSIRQRWTEGETAVVEGYLRIAELAWLGKKAMLNHDWDALGDLMNENHHIQRALGGSGPQNDYLIDICLANGALGAKLAGAGQGGTIVALTLEPDRTVLALRDAGAERIIWPRPVEGVSIEASWQQLVREYAAG